MKNKKPFMNAGMRALCIYNLVVTHKFNIDEAVSIIASNKVYWI